MSDAAVSARQRLCRLAETLVECEAVLGVDFFEDDPVHDLVVDVVLTDDCQGVPPTVGRCVVDAGATIHSVQHQGGAPTMWVIA